MQRAEVVVIGAGLAGASVAWQLAGRTAVTVVERGPQPGAQASAQNAGMVRTLGEDPFERALALRTAEWMADPDPDFHGSTAVTGALLGLGIDPHWLSDGVAHLRAHGSRVEAVDSFDALPPALHGAPLLRAWYLPDARVADPAALVRGFTAGATRRGAILRTGVSVQRLAVEGGRVVGVETDAGRISADAVVLAGGAWSGQLAAAHGLHRPLYPVRRTVFHTSAHGVSPTDHPWCWVDDVGVYARPEASGWLVSACDEAIDPPAGPESRGPADPAQRELAASKLATWFPRLAGQPLVNGWSGLRTFAPDRRPVLGADPELEGLWWAAGLGGFGVSTCYGVGEAVATWLLGGQLRWITPRGVSPGRDFPRRWTLRPAGDVTRGHSVDVQPSSM